VDRLNQRYQVLLKALNMLQSAVNMLTALEKNTDTFSENAERRQMLMDSVVLRFKYTASLFWKYLEEYLEHVIGLIVITGPFPVMRTSLTAGMMNVQETEKALEMIRDLNMLLRGYVDESTEPLTKKIAEYYVCMRAVAQRLEPKN
jgi:hypothetical protein